MTNLKNIFKLTDDLIVRSDFLIHIFIEKCWLTFPGSELDDKFHPA